ncbi:MAG: hypothetical protein JSS86_24700 [Cyanobacteria bacterium SZAS LIN-2]|nr:hypothetical protein [Cyanobacteria bacterium SZAS LIN-2]
MKYRPNRKTFLTPLMVLATLVCQQQTLFAAQAETETRTLKGGVEHAEELPGLDENLQVGRVYSDDLLMSPATQENNEWFLIPPWYAGVRHSEEAVIISRYEYATGRTTAPMQRQLNRQDSRSGYQVDRNGGIWDYKRVPSIQHVESDFCNAVLYIKEIKPISGSDSQLVIKYVEVSVSYEKRSKRILQVVQQEQINTITSPSPGTLRVDISVKSYGWDGKPNRQEQSVIIATMVEPFKKIDEYEGRDLKALFRDYLVSHNLQNLVPQ